MPVMWSPVASGSNNQALTSSPKVMALRVSGYKELAGIRQLARRKQSGG